MKENVGRVHGQVKGSVHVVKQATPSLVIKMSQYVVIPV